MSFKGETGKARQRRQDTGWFDKFAPSDRSGIDIGCQHDPVYAHFRAWDKIFGDSDATFMEGVPDDAYFTVYCSHVLEHLNDPITALRHWYRILSPGGCLIILVPHRDLYEGKKELPSRWNEEHKTFWLPEVGEPPCTRGLGSTISEAIPAAERISFEVLQEGWYQPATEQHPPGEYSIEAIVRKPV